MTTVFKSNARRQHIMQRQKTMRRQKTRKLLSESLEQRIVLDSTVVLNEVMYHPADTPSLEYVELFNQMGVDMDISGWQLAEAIEYTFPPRTVIPRGEYLVVSRQPDALREATGVGSLGPFTGKLADDGETLRLLDRNDRQLDSLRYSNEGDWPLAPDGLGASLAKINPNSTSGPADHWTSSILVGGTPGRSNFGESTGLQDEVHQTLITLDHAWRVEDQGNNLGEAWRELGFDDQQWMHDFPGPYFAGAAVLAGAEPIISPDVTASASSALPSQEAQNVVNGSGLIGTSHVVTPSIDNMWLSNGNFFAVEPDLEPEIRFDLGFERAIDTMRVWNFNHVDEDSCCLTRGLATADIWVAGDDENFELLIDNQPFNKASGLENDFFQDIDFDGIRARHIKIDVDTTNGVANHGDPLQFVGLSEVQFLVQEPAGTTELNLGPTTHYFRTDFEFGLAPGRTQLSLTPFLDDGAAIYLNGVEVHRQNLPPEPISSDTLAQSSVDANSSAPIVISNEHLQIGTNLLAVEVHQAEADDDDMAFGLEFTSVTAPPLSIDFDVLPLAINEIAAAGSAQLFVELQNYGNSTLDLHGVQLAIGDKRHTLAAGTQLASGERTVIDLAAANLTGTVGDRLAIYSSDSSLILDTVEIHALAQGRSPDGSGPFRFTRVATPDAANQFEFQDQIVINEIMYHYRPNAPDGGINPTFTQSPIMDFSSEWRYDDSGIGLPSDWHQTSHEAWPAGSGLLGFETSKVISPGIGTQLRENDFLAYYFESHIEIDELDLNTIDELQLQYAVDDGAVFYFNGNEFHRINMPDGEITPDTRASVSVNNATISDVVSIPKELLQLGSNRISVQVHQRTPTSSDLVFGGAISAATIIDPGTAATPYSRNDEEWIELYHRGSQPIDLSGWRFDSGIRFEFPEQSQMQPGDYWIIAQDAAAMQAKYPEIQVVGEFDGRLNNQTEQIRLLDSLENPADVVTYFEDGQWPAAADGRGSSLELQNPNADNAVGLAWAPSNEADDSNWTTYSYQGVTKPSSIGPDTRWNEFLLGMLSDGEILLDDIQVIESPNGAARSLIQNGNFESDTAGEPADSWRIIGNHRDSEVIVDPDDANNQVLRLVASGATEHMHNHAETTLKHDGEIVSIRNGVEYLISFRAKWISGANLLQSRLYFNRLARTSTIAQPDRHGTPGQQNSTFRSSFGPTITELHHTPVIPDAGQPVTISAALSDADGIQQVTLWYSIDSGLWTNTSMSARANGRYAAEVPGLPADSTVQFYVEGQDVNNVTSVFPRKGKASRALYKVQDGKANEDGLTNFRIIVTPDDGDFLHSSVELMSNGRIGATIVYDESEVYYDAGVRLSGSQRARPFQPRLSFSVGFPSDQLFRGVHGAITLDRSESTGFGQREHIYHHGMNHAGGLPSEYNDLFHIITPKKEHTGSAEAQLARYSDIFLDEQYANGSDGQLYEYELTYYPLATVERNNPEARKVPNPDSVNGIPIRYLSESNEDYRWAFLNKNNRVQDDYSQLIRFTEVMSLPNAGFESQVESVIDVDQWLRAFGFASITGHGDNYLSDGAQHNLQLYVRPEDNRVLLFPHDLDAFFEARRAIATNGDLRKLLRVPEWEHMYYGHIHDMIQTTFNEDYMLPWITHWGELLPRQRFTRHLTDLVRRSDFLSDQIERRAKKVDYSISTEDFSTETNVATIAGTGWINVRELRLAGSDVPLPTEWTEVTDWTSDVAIASGVNQITVEAYDFQGALIGTDTVRITSSAANPLLDSLRISEINYNPGDPTENESVEQVDLDNDDFEFIELINVGQVPINLLGVHFDAGITFTFGNDSLAAGERAVLVSDANAFNLRYGDGPRLLGEFASGKLANGGEQIRLLDAAGNPIIDLTYDDNDVWPARADGVGATLEMIDPSVPTDQIGKYDNWRASHLLHGTPGEKGTNGFGVVINEILTNPIAPSSDAIELLNTSNEAVDLSGWWLSDAAGNLQKFVIPAGTILEPAARIVFDETNFNPTPAAAGNTNFALSAGGDDVWLVIPNSDGELAAFVDDVHFIATRPGESLGRYPDGGGRLHPMSIASFGEENSEPRVGPVVISEVNYHPASPSSAAIEVAPSLVSDDLEFVEITNPSSDPLSLTDWRIRGGVDFDFGETSLAAGAAIIITSFNPESADNQTRLNGFRTHYDISNDVMIVGGFAGQLNDDFDKLQLRRPDSVANSTALTLEDEVVYGNWAPWPASPNGGGDSLTRNPLTGSGNIADHWRAARPTPGTVAGNADLNQDGNIDIVDVDLLCSAILAGEPQFDLNRDQLTNQEDLYFLITDVLQTGPGDANLDGRFDSQDLVMTFQSGEYEDDRIGNSTWAEGDWNCDGEFESGDLVAAFRDGTYSAAAVPGRNGSLTIAAIDQSFQPQQRSTEKRSRIGRRQQPIADPMAIDLELANLNHQLFDRFEGSDEANSDPGNDADWFDELGPSAAGFDF